MALRQGKGESFTPASAGCANSIEERIWRAIDHRARLFGSLCDMHRVQPSHLASAMPQPRASLPECPAQIFKEDYLKFRRY
jgi:hypothetical protein